MKNKIRLYAGAVVWCLVWLLAAQPDLLSQYRGSGGDASSSSVGDTANVLRGEMPDSAQEVMEDSLAQWHKNFDLSGDSIRVDSTIRLNGVHMGYSAGAGPGSDITVASHIGFDVLIPDGHAPGWSITKFYSDSLRAITEAGIDSLQVAVDSINENVAGLDVAGIATLRDSVEQNAAALDSVRDGDLGGGGGTSFATITITQTGGGGDYVAAVGDLADTLQVVLDSIGELGGGSVYIKGRGWLLDKSVYPQISNTSIIGELNTTTIAVMADSGEAINDTIGLNNFILAGISFIGTDSAWSVLTLMTASDNGVVKDCRFSGFVKTDAPIFQADTLSVGWRFTDLKFSNNHSPRFAGVYSAWNRIDIESPTSHGLAINWHHSSISDVNIRASGGVDGLVLTTMGGGSIDAGGGVNFEGGLCANVTVTFSDSNASNIGILVNPRALGGGTQVMLGGSISNFRCYAFKASDLGYGLHLDYATRVSVNSGSTRGFLRGVFVGMAAGRCLVNGVDCYQGDTGIYVDGDGCRINDCWLENMVTGINITSNSNSAPGSGYGNVSTRDNGTIVTDNGAGTDAGDTSGLYPE